jgi:hypothetical protein
MISDSQFPVLTTQVFRRKLHPISTHELRNDVTTTYDPEYVLQMVQLVMFELIGAIPLYVMGVLIMHTLTEP